MSWVQDSLRSKTSKLRKLKKILTYILAMMSAHQQRIEPYSLWDRKDYNLIVPCVWGVHTFT